jgi:hypothetical protein
MLWFSAVVPGSSTKLWSLNPFPVAISVNECLGLRVTCGVRTLLKHLVQLSRATRFLTTVFFLKYELQLGIW